MRKKKFQTETLPESEGLSELIAKYNDLREHLNRDDVTTDQQIAAVVDVMNDAMIKVLEHRPSNEQEANDKIAFMRSTGFWSDAVVEFNKSELEALYRSMQINDEPKDAALIELGKDMERHNDDVHRLQWEAGEQSAREYEKAVDSLCEALDEVEKQTASTLEGVKVKAMAIKYANGSDGFKEVFGNSSTDMRLAAAVVEELLALDKGA